MRLRVLMTMGFLLIMAGCVPAVQVQLMPPPAAAVAEAMVTPAPAPLPAVQVAVEPAQAPPTKTEPATTTPSPAKPADKPPTTAPGGDKKPPTTPATTKPDRPSPATAEPPAKAPVVPRLAILVYHDVDATASGGYTVSQSQFDEQVKMLKEEGYAFYRLADVERLLAGGQGMPEKGVMLAFDDGYQSFATRVLPVARKYGVPAVCFVVTKYMNFDIIFGRPHMSTVELQQVSASGLLELAGHSYDGHRTAETADGSEQPVLTHRIRKPQSSLIETSDEYAARVLGDFQNTARVLREVGAGTGVRHFTFPYTARSDEAVSLGRQAGFRYFYVGGEQLVRPDSDPGAIPRVHAGAPDISAEVLRETLRRLFAQP
ncbi:MAG TPA: polysaccharide deacetylase family protein [Symbiobacteriaceae bacterium]|nr:polysaccharide deacetylase family protein [Symbiobacteriaceae bacterium]